MLWEVVGIISAFLFFWACIDFAVAHLKARTNDAALKALLVRDLSGRGGFLPVYGLAWNSWIS